MATVTWTNKTPSAISATLEIVGFYSGKSVPAGAHSAIEVALGKNYKQLLSRLNFEGKAESTILLDGSKRAVLVVGLGDPKKLTMPILRKASAHAGRAASSFGSAVASYGIAASKVLDANEVATGMLEGFNLGTYVYDSYKKSNKIDLKKVIVSDVTKASTVAAFKRSAAICEGVLWAREAINTPPNAKAPKALAADIQKLFKSSVVKVTVLDEAAIKKKKMAGVMAVGQGSENRPRFVRLSYRAPGAKKTLAFVGKGVIFDSGGLSIKVGDGMKSMKCDMSGAAAVAGAFKAIAQMKPKVNLEGYIPLVENMPSGSAYRVDDIITYRNGVTVEVQNTDAEGRLILADALIEASEGKPDGIVDLATLTGSCVVALGDSIAAALSNSDTFRGKVIDASEKAGERFWPMPLPSDYRALIDTPVATVANAGARAAGTITAGLFLQEFVNVDHWCHLDIAGPAFLDKTDGENTAGGTGFGVRTLVQLAESYV
ncbi:MAG TPA: leucyl aminopeptidase [Acidimicrobiia bacterium]|nr:leucyl aminopeptidase [Acidimicrobiia bacterium]